MKHNSNNSRSLNELISSNKLLVAYIFLGIGLTLFLLNISSLLSFVMPGAYHFQMFDLSLFGSMIIIIASTYMIHYN